MRPERLELLAAEAWSHSAHGPLLLRETAEDGRAELRLELPEGWEGWRLQVSGEGAFPLLRNRKNPDGAVLLRGPDQRWQAHLFEIKHRLRPLSRPKAIEQLHAGAVRLRWIADFLGLSPERWAGWLVVGQREAPAGGVGPRQPVEALPGELARANIVSMPVEELVVGLQPEKAMDAALGWDGGRWALTPT